MIHEVDEALRELVRSRALPGNEVEVAFEAPTKDWAARRNAPTVNIYLYDIREDMRKRSRGMINAYDDLGKIESRHMPPRHIKLSYLLTAWTQRPEDEHRLLSALLTSLLSYEEMPRELLTGSLAQIGRPVAVTVALPPPEDRSFADVWTALGGELKPSLDVVISAPVMAGRVFQAAQTATAGMSLVSTDTETGESDDPLRHLVEYPTEEEIAAAAGSTIAGTVVRSGRGGGRTTGAGATGGGRDGGGKGGGGSAGDGDSGTTDGTGGAGGLSGLGGAGARTGSGHPAGIPGVPGEPSYGEPGPGGAPTPRIAIRRRMRIGQTAANPAGGISRGGTSKGSASKDSTSKDGTSRDKGTEKK
ncbi:hypothetical protein GCM10009765_07370 [Fodinicola feengrottensis]|uniref:Pvc16 N-terminal domain-containing protein n=1 Tax=Fodinicola feengrottensis TaxID=435914 RepID=A0ABN2FWK7_9ACTN